MERDESALDDIFATARAMVQRHGHLAPVACGRKADSMHLTGDSDREALWLAVREVTQALLQFGPPADIPGLPSG
ncbi:MAG TPA: hypothetical protein VMT54_00545 [Candidatus Cybelea sp.]|nr:hypothetical protein [Candidatus Cybelea sp.]